MTRDRIVIYDNVAGGWPFVLSGLKTLLETGSTLKPEAPAKRAI